MTRDLGSEPPRDVRRLHFLGKLESCQVVRQGGGIRRSCVNARCGWSPRSVISTIRSGRQSVRSPACWGSAARTAEARSALANSAGLMRNGAPAARLHSSRPIPSGPSRPSARQSPERCQGRQDEVRGEGQHDQPGVLERGQDLADSQAQADTQPCSTRRRRGSNPGSEAQASYLRVPCGTAAYGMPFGASGSRPTSALSTARRSASRSNDRYARR